MNNKDRVPIKTVLIMCLILGIALIVCHPFVANAQESISENTIEQEPEAITDEPDISDSQDTSSSSNDDGDRINHIEIRMQEMNICIDELRESLSLLETASEEDEQKRIEISDKLDLIVIALDDLINANNQYLDMYADQQTKHIEFTDSLSEYLEQNKDVLQSISENTLEQTDLSVSGNSLATDMNDMLKASNEENRKQNEENMTTYMETSTEHTTYILVFIAIVVGVGIGSILSGHIKKGT